MLNQVTDFLELHLDNLVNRLPISLALLSYQLQEEIPKKKQLLHTNKPISSSLSEYITSESWLVNSNLAEKPKLLEIQFKEEKQAYIFPLNCTCGCEEYILCLADDELSLGDKDCLETQGQLLQSYLTKIQEISLLENLIKRLGHEISNPLSLITLLSENLRLNLPQGFCQEQALSIQQTANHLNTKLNDLINCGKSSSLKLSLFDLKLVLLESWHNLKPVIETKKLTLKYPNHKQAIVSLDYLQMKLVFDNLFNNAVYFSPEKGIITCNWHIFQGEILISISDQGQGFSRDDLNNLFTPFYSSRQGGTGLGLTIVKKVILDHHGSIWANNLPQGGAQFNFSLPTILQ